MKHLIKLGKVFDQINMLMVTICAIFFIGFTLLVGADITLRYFFNKPFGWTKEVSEYILVVFGFLAAAWILKDDGHVKMDLVLNSVNEKTRTMMGIITSIIAVIIVFIITWFTIRVTIDLYLTNFLTQSVLAPPKWILMTPIFIGSFLLVVQFIRRTYGLICHWKKITGYHNNQTVLVDKGDSK